MKLTFEILLCAFATFGVYALFARLVASLLRRERCHLAVKCDGKTAEEAAALMALALLRTERDRHLSREAAILLDEDDAALENALLAEGFLVYKRKK